MAKFSVDGDDDGEGPSNPSQKRQRTSVLFGTAREDVGCQSSSEEIQEEELEDEESEQEQEGMQSEENYDDPTLYSNYDDSPHSAIPRSNNNDREDPVSVMTGRDKSISVFLTDPEVLDCFICYEPLSIPVFQCENGHIACSSCCVNPWSYDFAETCTFG
ncbi:hypothetical protein L6164_023624 [Bauhinia variegata]|uniref:Uncharacterized protein n=1 Tax=Bauhinia variegata TaxID=167791 RepID=A0ACB9MIS3_BAUVA|nr:hypothetical protein L6164_023624 [Bauhinia variegata]